MRTLRLAGSWFRPSALLHTIEDAPSNGDHAPAANAFYDPRAVTWTEYYGKEDVYSRMDYILLSPALAPAWDRNGTYILTMPDWGVASDHRPIVATFNVKNN